MSFNEKLARQLANNRRQLPTLDACDLQAESEGRSTSAMRDALPSVMGARISGARGTFRNTKVGSSHNINLMRERKLGYGA